MSITYVDGVTNLDAAHMNALQQKVEKGAANGYASLDATGKVPSAQLPVAGFPTGGGCDWYAATAPAGFLLCDGSAVSRTTYAALYAIVGTIWGVGDGSTTFNLPDTRGRTIIGFAASGGHAEVATLGGNDGTALASRRPRHSHTNGVTASAAGLTLPNHVHSQSLTLPNHAHSLSDPGHSHAIGNFGLQGVGGTANGGLTPTDFSNGSQPAGTGMSVGNPTSLPAIGGSIGNPTTLPAVGGTITVGGTVGTIGSTTDAPSYVVVNQIIKT